MAGPYGITQFDAAGVIGNYQAMQQNRIQMMVLQKQQAKLDRDEKTASGVSAAINAYTNGGNAPAASASSAPAAPSDPLAPLPAARAAAPAAHPSSADREKLFGTLMTLDPEIAGNVMDAFSKMDKAQLDKSKVNHERLMQIAAGVMQLDPSQRHAAIQQSAPELEQLGLPREQIDGFDPSDQNLRQMIVQGMDVERIAQFVHPNYMNVNGEVVDENALARGDSHPVRYRSEYIDTPEGLDRRPGGGTQPPTLTDEDILRMEQGGPTEHPSGGFP